MSTPMRASRATRSESFFFYLHVCESSRSVGLAQTWTQSTLVHRSSRGVPRKVVVCRHAQQRVRYDRVLRRTPTPAAGIHQPPEKATEENDREIGENKMINVFPEGVLSEIPEDIVAYVDPMLQQLMKRMGNGPDCVIADLISTLMHWPRLRGMDPEEEIERARSYFEDELYGI